MLMAVPKEARTAIDDATIRLVGRVDVKIAPEIHAVIEKTGIQPPPWFDVSGTTLASMNVPGAPRGRRRK